MKKEKKPMKKGLKVFLGILTAIVFIALCMGAVGLYIIHDRNKPVFELPDIDPLPAVTELPADGAEAAAYVNRLYETVCKADDVEGAWHTDVSIGALQTPLGDADNAMLQFFASQAQGQIAALYPQETELIMAKTDKRPAFALDKDRIMTYSGKQLKTDADKAITDEGEAILDHYLLSFVCTPADVDAALVQSGDIYRSVTETLAPAMTVESFAVKPETEEVTCTIDRPTDDLLNLTVKTSYTLTVLVRFTDAYAALGSEPVEITVPYETTLVADFQHYGARFTERQIAENKGAMQALPMEVVVHSTATKDDYTLTFDISNPEAIEVDADGVMRVHEVCDEPVTITMTLQYDGHTYTDTLTVYLTELEIPTTVNTDSM